MKNFLLSTMVIYLLYFLNHDFEVNIMSETLWKHLIGKSVHVIIDRPMGSVHPEYNFLYPINYGYIPDTISGDGEELDAYILGILYPLKEFVGKVIAVIHREDNDDKLVVVNDENLYSDEEIWKSVYFQEQFFSSEIIRK